MHAHKYETIQTEANKCNTQKINLVAVSSLKQNIHTQTQGQYMCEQ